jgi:molybdopterin synthase catalytic subunit
VVRLQREPIDAAPLMAEARGDGDGAIALFLGTVRNASAGKTVLFLEYEAYEGMAEREMARIESQALETFALSRVAIVHRFGRLEIGDVSVAVVVAAPHRAPAMDACRFIIDTLKASVPIWKREHGEGGVVWIEGHGGAGRS